MKHYPKTYEDVSRKASKGVLAGMGSSWRSVEELTSRCRSFYKDAYSTLFELAVKQVWLEQKFTYTNVRRARRSSNGYGADWAFSYFIQAIVGTSQKPLTSGFIFTVIHSYFKDFFPNFSDHDPFTEPEYFRFPYKNITPYHLVIVYQCKNRMEMLAEAEKRAMGVKEFINWAVNWAFCYNDDVGKQVYSLVRYDYIPYLKNNKRKK